MTSKNKYWNHSHISEAKTRHLLREFSYDSTATETSTRTEISRVTVNRFYALLRERIVLLAHNESLEVSQYDFQPSEYTVLPSKILPCIIGNNSALEQFLTI